MSDYHRPFAEQVAFFKAKLNLPSERWDDIRHEEHDRSFIVAGAKAADLLADLHAAVLKAKADGTGLNTFQKDFKALVARNGWTGWTGEGSKAGVAWRTKVIYQTNMATSYAAGRYQQLTDPELLAVLPYWQYKHSDGVMFPRPLHVSWDGLTLSPDHPFWKTHFAPNGWGCHCRIIAVPKSDYLKAIANGRGPANAPAADDIAGIDPGFAYTPGASVADELRALLNGKVVKLPGPIGQALAANVAKVLNAPVGSLSARVRDIGNQIAEETNEHVVVLSANGRELLRKVGSVDSVRLSPAELPLLPGAVMIHNHPGKAPEGFSMEDVRLAIWHDLAEMHVVDNLFQYSLARALGVTWGPDYWSKIETVFVRVEADVKARLNDALSRGLIAEDQYHVLMEHMIWLEVDAEVAIGYSRTPRSGLER
mgnify:CR=1 FL=1